MALKYADYVKEDQLEAEIADANVQEQARDEESGIPDRFKGKSRAEIAASYVELERLNSRQAQDLGSMRRTVDTLLELQPTQSLSQESKADEPSVPVTADEIYEDPDSSIRRVAREESAGQIKEVKRNVDEIRRAQALAQFDSLHPDWRQTVVDPEFVGWVREAPYRLRMAQAADQFDLEAADALLNMYNEEQNRKQAETNAVEREQRRQRAVRNASLESSGPVTPESVPTFSRNDLINKKIAAKRGDEQADRYLKTNGAAIQLAYAEGRITD